MPREQWGIYCLKDFALSQMEIANIEDRTIALFSTHRDLRSVQRYKTTNMDRARLALKAMEMGARRQNGGGNSGGNHKVMGAPVVARRPTTEKAKTDKARKIQRNRTGRDRIK